jgi:hypothetical protein
VRRGIASAALAAIVALTACATQPPPAAQVLASESLAFLADGKTTREEVTLHLGLPARTFESDRIAIYRIGWGRERGARSLDYAPVAPPAFDLVLVFDASAVLTRHALVAK